MNNDLERPDLPLEYYRATWHFAAWHIRDIDKKIEELQKERGIWEAIKDVGELGIRRHA